MSDHLPSAYVGGSDGDRRSVCVVAFDAAPELLEPVRHDGSVRPSRAGGVPHRTAE